MQVGENEPFVSELLTTLPVTIADLEPHQIHSFYESVCSHYVPYSSCGFVVLIFYVRIFVTIASFFPLGGSYDSSRI